MRAVVTRMCGRAVSGSVLLWLTLVMSADASAELGSCEFRFHSTYTKRSYLVCQTVDSGDQCGTWDKSGPPQPFTGYAEGKQAGRVQFRSTKCQPERAVAMCKLPRGKMYFYEGNAKELESGCSRMKGEFFAQAPEARAMGAAAIETRIE
jgi:hypothetical protein